MQASYVQRMHIIETGGQTEGQSLDHRMYRAIKNIARQKRKHRQHGLHGHDSNPKLAYVLSLLVKFQLYRYAVYRRPCGIKNGPKPPKSRYFPNFQVWVAFVPTTSPIWAKYGAQKYSHGIYLSAEFELARFTVSPFTCNCRPVIAGSQRSSANVTNT